MVDELELYIVLIPSKT